MARTEQAVEHIIPPITDPLGRNWDQPSREEIAIDDHHALMTRATFERLAEYSASYPSLVYPGKMWKRYDGIYDPDFLRAGGRPSWKLCWYVLSGKGLGACLVDFRDILLADEPQAQRSEHGTN